MAIGGVLMVSFGAALMAIALYLTGPPRNPEWLLGIAWITGVLASAAICQGTVLILTGQWLL